MNLKNLMMWGVIVLLVVGLFNLFQNPKQPMTSDTVPFSNFLKNVEDGRVVQVEIKGNNIEGVFSDGTTFNTYAPNDPNLVEKLNSSLSSEIPEVGSKYMYPMLNLLLYMRVEKLTSSLLVFIWSLLNKNL